MLPLSEDYIPEKFFFREEQVRKIKETFSQFKKDRYSIINLIILGTTGAGKTGVVKKMMYEGENYIYVSALNLKTTNSIFKKISETKKKFVATSDSLNGAVNIFKENPKILIIDEVGKINDMENFCNYLNAFYRETQVPIILITNKWTFIQEMPDDARLTLFLEKVEFPSYNTKQLKEILIDRINATELEIGKPLNINDSELEYLCCRIVKEHFSSVRIALRILNRCFASDNYSKEFLDKTIDYLVELDYASFVNKLSPTEKDFLGFLLEYSDGNESIPITEIINLPESRRFGEISRISQLTTALIDYGFIKAKYHHLGRKGGKHRILIFDKDYKEKLLKLLNPWDIICEDDKTITSSLT